jgi:hypothetical protein
LIGAQVTDPNESTLRILAHEDDGNGLKCPVCKGRDTVKRRIFQPGRLGAPFLLGGILPTLLEYAPDGERPADHPCRGRRLLTFNDSRQGTARMAAKLQQDAERNRVRGLVYHLALAHFQNPPLTPEQLDLKRELEQALAIEGLPETTKRNLKEQLANIKKPTPISFTKAAQLLAKQGRDFDYMHKHYRRYAPGTFGEAEGSLELARMFLVREFGRRPRRLNNLESMGLVAVRYPALQNITNVPAVVGQAAGFDPATWRDFLKICLDFFVRAGGSLSIPQTWRNWLGMPFPQSYLVSRDEPHVGHHQRRWPRARRSGMRSTLVRLLAFVLDADIYTAMGEDRIDALLQSAWEDLTGAGLLPQFADGRILSLDNLAFAPMRSAWICPVTRRFLDTTLRGVTPYLPQTATPETAICQRVDLPLYDKPFGGIDGDLERIGRGREWLKGRADIEKLREQGLWSDLNDRVIELAPYFTAAEHSAQQDSRTLDRYEKAFKAGDLNLLSCSTTMEMGIDIGGIAQVAMNNVPPHPANYLQRAGRAGRRREARSLVMTLCKSNPLDQSVFGNSRWAFDTPLPVPRVSLDSPVIVQRHVHSLLLSRFLAENLAGQDQEQTKLTAGLFLLGESPLAERYAVWCRHATEQRDRKLVAGLKQLICHSVFEGMDLNHLLDQAAVELDEIARTWRLEWANLEAEENEIRQSAGQNGIALRAVAIHKARLEGEYLLRELCSRGYLPAYGFPTHIAAFDNLTFGRVRQLAHHADQGREDNRFRRRELANRDLATALREYAPGAEIVMDGLVYRSAGVTLNWHIPADQTGVKEIQDIRFAWRCRHCGASGSSSSLDGARGCNACSALIDPADIREFLKPAGFAVDFFKDPSNDVMTQHFIPVEAPWIDARGEWMDLPNPDLGRFRVSSQGHVFHQSSGINGKGYALCLECGRAEPMAADNSLPDAFTLSHRKLRRASEEGFFCPGSDNPWKIKQGIILGHESWTDVFELQLKNEAGVWLNDSIVARTLAVALRDALAELIGVQAIEMGCDAKPARPEPGCHCQSILIFDRYAAGYTLNADRHLAGMFHRARRRLQCPANCDSACPHCVLDYDQRFAADSLDRHAVLGLLTDSWLKRLSI